MESAYSLRDRQTIPSCRIDSLDSAKGIFIILILALHHLNGADSLKRYLYSMGVTPVISLKTRPKCVVLP